MKISTLGVRTSTLGVKTNAFMFSQCVQLMEGVKNYALYVIYTSVQTMEGVKNFMTHVFTLACIQVSVFANNK